MAAPVHAVPWSHLGHQDIYAHVHAANAVHLTHSAATATTCHQGTTVLRSAAHLNMQQPHKAAHVTCTGARACQQHDILTEDTASTPRAVGYHRAQQRNTSEHAAAMCTILLPSSGGGAATCGCRVCARVHPINGPDVVNAGAQALQQVQHVSDLPPTLVRLQHQPILILLQCNDLLPQWYALWVTSTQLLQLLLQLLQFIHHSPQL